MTASQVKEIDISGILNAYVYMDEQSTGYQDRSLYEIMESMPNKKSGYYKTVMAAIDENPLIGQLELIDQSFAPNNHDDKLIIACTFRDPNTDTIYVAYRGTGDGKWVDNGEGMVKESTVMQQEAAKYFDRVVDEVLTEEQKNSRIIVTGHSKGGNEAQYVTMASKNRDLIDNCYSIDGQGFSPAAIAKFGLSLGPVKYQEYCQKMYSICGENDYVHDLGRVIIPKENTYIIETPGANDFGGYHDIKEMISGAGFNWTTDEKGNIAHGEQGIIGIIAKNVSENMMKMDPERRYDCAITVMFALEFFLPYNDKMGGEFKFGTGFRKCPTVEEVIGCLSSVLPLFIETFADVVKDLAEKAMSEFVSSLVKWVNDQCRQVAAWMKKTFNAGYKYSQSNPYICVDTGSLRRHADSLEKIYRKVKTLDERINNLYWAVGIQGLFDLMRADTLMNYRWRLWKCAEYLDYTAGQFENAERTISGG